MGTILSLVVFALASWTIFAIAWLGTNLILAAHKNAVYEGLLDMADIHIEEVRVLRVRDFLYSAWVDGSANIKEVLMWALTIPTRWKK